MKIDNYNIFLEKNILTNGKLIGYKIPHDEYNPILVYELNNKHFFLENYSINELIYTKGKWYDKDTDYEYLNLNDENVKAKIDGKYRKRRRRKTKK